MSEDIPPYEGLRSVIAMGASGADMGLALPVLLKFVARTRLLFFRHFRVGS